MNFKDMYFANEQLKKIINIANPSIDKFEIDISQRKTNIYTYASNKKMCTQVCNLFMVLLGGLNWRQLTLIDLCSIDKLRTLTPYESLDGKRFQLKYTFNSLNTQDQLNIYIDLREKFEFFSLEKIIPSTIWLQREIWDMYGIIFKGSSDLRRILTDYGFRSFPLRVDFPVFGNLELYYDIEMSELLFKKVDAVQENRFFGYNKNLFWF
jgi:NADH:ubiquinone oxidoreductase subunit C